MEYKLFKLLVENIPHPMWIKDPDLRFIYVNKEYINICNGKDKEFIGRKYEEIFTEDETKEYKSKYNFAINTLKSQKEDCYIYGENTECNILPLIDENGKLQAIAGVYSNLSIIREKDKVIEEQENILKVVMDTLPGMVFYKDKDGKYVYVNKEFDKFYNRDGIDKVVGKTNFEIHRSKELAIKYTEEDNVVIETKQSIFAETILKSKEGKDIYTGATKVPVISKNNEVVGVVGLVLDITEKKEVEEQLRNQSFTDVLTGLYNRNYFEKKAKELFSKEYLPIGVIMGDANGLKLVNDTLGHSQGDELLKLMAGVLRDVCNEGQLIFRTGGDEF